MDDDNLNDSLEHIKIDYIRANRCWRSNNLKSCLLICDKLSRQLAKLPPSSNNEINRSKNLIWYLKIKCLADDYYLNEPLLLNEEDIGDQDDQVRSINHPSSQSSALAATTATFSPTGRDTTAARKFTTATGSRIDTATKRRATAVLTGKRSSLSSRQSSRGASSYRPLTTSLTATQTAFSRSTRPLLKYANCNLLSKDLFEYLYNVQTVTNKCPDYRQCLEYLNLVQKSLYNNKERKLKEDEIFGDLLVDISAATVAESFSDLIDKSLLGSFWLIAQGMCYYNLRMNNEAQEYFNLAKNLNPKHLDTYTWLVKVYLRTNQVNQVLKTCQNGLKQCKSAILYNWMARVQSLLNDLFGANLSMKESLKFYPTNIEALSNVGHFAFYRDKQELSLRCYERIQQLSARQSTANPDSDYQGGIASSAQLLNNLALANFYCGYYHRVLPFFLKALLNSPNKEVTSDIWFNLSFVPLNCGFTSLSMACLKLALKNDSQNEEALNNLGVLKYGSFIDDDYHFANKQELWGSAYQHQRQCATTSGSQDPDSTRKDDLSKPSAATRDQIPFDEIETFFVPASNIVDHPSNEQQDRPEASVNQPEMLYNMAIVKKRRGHLLASLRYCKLYSEHDQNNYHIHSMMREIKQLVSHNNR